MDVTAAGRYRSSEDAVGQEDLMRSEVVRGPVSVDAYDLTTAHVSVPISETMQSTAAPKLPY